MRTWLSAADSRVSSSNARSIATSLSPENAPQVSVFVLCTSKVSKLSFEPFILHVLSGVECAFFFYFCTSKASKLSTEPLILRVLSGVECAGLYEVCLQRVHLMRRRMRWYA